MFFDFVLSAWGAFNLFAIDFSFLIIINNSVSVSSSGYPGDSIIV